MAPIGDTPHALPGALERRFDATFTTRLGLREKQVQQSYRPIIGIHKWFARRPGTVFRSLLLSEFGPDAPLSESFWKPHALRGVIADPFMGGGTPIYEANRLGFGVSGTDINPMAFWVVRQSLSPLDLEAFDREARSVGDDLATQIEAFYQTRCARCDRSAPVKYFLWVKVGSCPDCGMDNDLFPGYLLAEATRHPKHVVACQACGALNELDRQPGKDDPAACHRCGADVVVPGPARRNSIACRGCGKDFRYPEKPASAPPRHRLWAIEYQCGACKASHDGRFFKEPDAADLDTFARARARLHALSDVLPIPSDPIPNGDETDRLHRWGYRRFRDMFNERQLLSLGLLLDRIRAVLDESIRHALLTVFSDCLRYQNMLCRYDTYALKCQDIFSVHGFPVGLVQCENNVLGIPRVGSGGFRHFVEKYRRAKAYAQAPFETRQQGMRKAVVPIPGERIEASFVDRFPHNIREARLVAAPATAVVLPPLSLDGVFTDPPYFDNVQYAELMDFCYAWLRLGLAGEVPAFTPVSTRHAEELTGNVTLGRDLTHFTQGLSEVFTHYAAALKPGAPFVFTYHHNKPEAYLPLIVAILDAGLDCTATLPVAAEMGASLHISGTGSSVLDSVFVCRRDAPPTPSTAVPAALLADVRAMTLAGVRVSRGDIRCLMAGHVARLSVNRLRPDWNRSEPLAARMVRAKACVVAVSDNLDTTALVDTLLSDARTQPNRGEGTHAETV